MHLHMIVCLGLTRCCTSFSLAQFDAILQEREQALDAAADAGVWHAEGTADASDAAVWEAAAAAADAGVTDAADAADAAAQTDAWDEALARGTRLIAAIDRQRDAAAEANAAAAAAADTDRGSPEPLQHLIGGQPAEFFHYRSQYMQQHGSGFDVGVPEHAAVMPGNPGVIRTRLNPSAPTSMTQAVADRLGLQRQPLPGEGGRSLLGGGFVALEVLAEPLTVQLLAGPDSTAITFTLPVVIVVPSPPGGTFWELQLGMYDVLTRYDMAMADDLVLEDLETGEVVRLPWIAPKP